MIKNSKDVMINFIYYVFIYWGLFGVIDMLKKKIKINN